MLGQFRLQPIQVQRLGYQKTSYVWEDEGAAAIEATAESLENNEFTQFELRGDYFIASTVTEDTPEEPHVGQYRVKFHYNECGLTTVMAQQIKDNDDQHTLRKWNPEKLRVEYGKSTDAEADGTMGPALCCYICMCVNCCMNTMFEEVVDQFQDGSQSAEEYFASTEGALETAGKVFRPLGIFLTIFGFYLLFSPIISLLDWIPLVGGLLSTIVAFAAAIFSIVVGLSISCLTIAVAWVFFRPLIGILLLACTAAGIYLCFFFDPEQFGLKPNSSDVTPEPTPTPTVT
jgi:hypothetical protein